VHDLTLSTDHTLFGLSKKTLPSFSHMFDHPFQYQIVNVGKNSWDVTVLTPTSCV